ncbi:MAG TPA: class I adenylate-forming enzyme family protein [Mycobacteriales bacterium]|nr:class I adenylate-forming enzyme family protein [Mycobacteriales bacterium]
MGIEVLLDIPAGALADRVALGARTGGLTFADLAARAAGGATLLRDSGAKSVAFTGVNGPAFNIAVFAAAIAGLPISPLNYRLQDADLAELLERLDAPVVLADADQVARVDAHAHAVITTDDFLVRSATAAPAEPAYLDDDATAVVLFTSGTTSKPKGVVLKHAHLTAYVLQTVELLAAGDDEAALVAVPPYHVAGVATVLSNTYAGRRVVHLPQFTPAGWLDVVRTEGITSAMVVPTMLARVVEHLTQGDEVTDANVPSLRSLAYGGARVHPATLERALAAMPTVGFVNAYGLTETSSTICVLGPDDHRAAVASTDDAVRARLASAGRPVPGIELLVRKEDGTAAGPNEVGELFVRGAQVSGEYVGSGSALDSEGWFPTRDRAWIDPDGFLFIEGRSDDTIIRGGENIAPAEIEDVLTTHDAVADAAVVGLPDEEWGECIHAVVVLHQGATADPEELRAFCRERLRGSKTPDSVRIWEELPYTPTGKLLRREIIATLTS